MDDQQQAGNKRPWALLILLLFGAVFAIVLLLLRRPSATAPPSAEALPLMGTVPPFSLTDASGRTITLDALKGKIWLADFIFTRCEGTCPIMTSTLYQVNQELDSTLGIQLVSFSVDPAHDTPDVLKAYADNNGLPRNHWYFLTGDRNAIYSLAKEGFHLPVSDSGETERLITHSAKLALIDPTGQIRGYYDGTDSLAVPAVQHGVATLLHEGQGRGIQQ